MVILLVRKLEVERSEDSLPFASLESADLDEVTHSHIPFSFHHASSPNLLMSD